MSFDHFTEFFSWLNAHPHWVGLIVFATAMSESLVIVGLLVPGFLMMVGFGALIATGYLDFWSTSLYATAGAFLGDSLSYWIGKRYQHRLESVWPLSRYPHLINKGETFFARYGAFSVVLGRFFGPLRAIIPAVAGMANMPRPTFYFANGLSALAWAPLYLLPGIMFGMSIELAREFAGQIAFLIAIIFVAFILTFVVIKSIYTWLTPQTDVLMYRLLIWSRRHPTSGRVSEALINPQQSEIRALSVLGLLLLGTVAAYFLVTHWYFDARLFSNVDLLVFKLFQSVHLPLLDSLFYGFALLGERISIIIIYVIVIIYFSLTQRVSTVMYSLAALILPWLTADLLDISYYKSFIEHPESITNQWHANSLFFIDVCALAFLSVLLGRSAHPFMRGFLYLSITMILLLVALAQLYFGIQWLSEIVSGFLLGLIWISILSIAYRCHAQHQPSSKHTTFSVVLLIMLVAVPFFVANTGHVSRIKPVKINPVKYVMSDTGWHESGWKMLPASRQDLNAENIHPFTIQWHATKSGIIDGMQKAGWRKVDNTASDFLTWMNNKSQLMQLPVLPHVHAGLYSELHFSRVVNNKLMIVRLWQSDFKLHNTRTNKPSSAILWFGTATFSDVKRTMHLNYLVSDNDFITPVIKLQKSLAANDSISLEIIKTPTVQPFLLLVDAVHQE